MIFLFLVQHKPGKVCFQHVIVDDNNKRTREQFMEKIIRNPGSRNRKVHCYDKSRVCNKRYLCRDVIWNRHLWEKVNSERATRFLAISSVSSIIKCGWLFPNQWFGLHLRWLFSNFIFNNNHLSLSECPAVFASDQVLLFIVE